MTEHVEKISPSVMRALRAVERGEVLMHSPTALIRTSDPSP
jgi:hypothetical protein